MLINLFIFTILKKKYDYNIGSFNVSRETLKYPQGKKYIVFIYDMMVSI